MRPPYNLQMVTRGLFLQRNRATPEHRGQFSNASCKGSSSSSYQPRPCNVWPTTISVDGRACSYGVSNDKAGVCGLWDACPIVVVAQRPIDWRLAAGQLNTLWVCCCCRLAGVTPANSIGLDSTVFFVRESWWYNNCTDLLNHVLQPWSTVGSPVS